MKRQIFLLSVIIIAAIAAIRCNKSVEVVREEAHWEYENPDWQQIGYLECGTKSQSPVDIPTSQTILAQDLPAISVNYSPFAMNIVDNSHTIQVNATDTLNTTVFNGIKYTFAQLHLHRKSEHTIDKKASDMELHVVHVDAEGNILVFARMIRAGVENAFLKTVFDNIPSEKKKEVETGVILDLRDMMPSDESYYTYSGTLTTPPCTHAVQFVIFKEPMEASTAQISYFESYYADNARPVQPLHNRLILEKPTESL